VTITTEGSTNGAATSSRMNLSGYVGHVTSLNVHYCVLFSSKVKSRRVRVRIRFSVKLVSCYAHVFVLVFDCHCHTAHCQWFSKR